MNYKNFKELSEKALGNEPAELVFKNANVVNVFTEEILHADIAIQNGYIVGVGSYNGVNEVELDGKHVVPGFIDAHLHLESTLVAPNNLVSAALKKGTTTFIVDPHEAANVSGPDGIDYIINQTQNVDGNVFVMVPSCVPVSNMEENGYLLRAEEMCKYTSNPRVLGLAEVMDFVSVIEGEETMMKKLALFDGKVKDGHAPGLNDYQLAAYALAKITTDHENIDFEYAIKQARAGIHVLIREGSGARNLDAIVKGIVANKSETSRFAFCTDDKHISDIDSLGHIDYNVRRSIELGIEPIKAIKMATINAATCYGLNELGAIAPGYKADLVILNDLASVNIDSVYAGGKKIDPNGKPNFIPAPENMMNSIHVGEIDKKSIALRIDGGRTDAIEVMPGQIITKRVIVAPQTRDSLFIPDSIINKVAVIERHKNTGHVGVAPVVGFNINGGAIGTSMSHDSHNIVIIGDNDEAILRALDELKRARGGYTIIQGDDAITLPLPIMGLMSQDSPSVIEDALRKIKARAWSMGVDKELDPLIVLSFVSLTVIPEIRVTTRGLFDATNQKYIREN